MTRLHDAFDELIAQHPEHDPDELWATAIGATASDAVPTAASPHRHPRRAWLAAAAVVSAAALATALATSSDDALVAVGSGPSPTAAPVPREPGGTTTTVAPEPIGPAVSPTTALVVASERGVEVRLGAETIRLVDEPAGLAHAMPLTMDGDIDGPWLAVYQRASGQVGYALTPTRPVEVVAGDDRWTIEPGPGTDAGGQITLFDLRRYPDGRVEALIAEQYGSTSPTPPGGLGERLVAVDLDTRARRVIHDQPDAWEAIHWSGRLLPDGDVVAAGYIEATMEVRRWSEGRAEPVWSFVGGIDVAPFGIDVDVAEGTLLQVSGDHLRVILTLVRFDLATGAEVARTRSFLQMDGRPVDPSYRCTELLGEGGALCVHGIGSAPPLVIRLEGDGWEPRAIEGIEGPVVISEGR